MQCVLFYGRLFSRAVANGVYNVGSGSGPPSHQQQSQQSTSSSTKSSLESSSSRFRLLTAVSGFSKNKGTERKGNLPGKFGDDAYFVAKHQLGDVIGVADGVGGWRAWGIDPGEFSQTLMASCERHICPATFTPQGPAALLARAYADLEHAKQHVMGSSTACLVVVRGSSNTSRDLHQATLQPIPTPTTTITSSSTSSSSAASSSDGGEGGAILTSANIGDSGYLVVRAGAVVHRSHEQQHYFNTPFQLSLPPPGRLGQVLRDDPSSADTREFAVEAGDLLVVATDGVFDNLPVASLLQLLQPVQGTSELADLQKAANLIAQSARDYANDEEYMSPFAISAKRMGIDTQGGKPDDITVVLATILD